MTTRPSDYVLIGTGVAPLLAARHLMEKGLHVLLLNPDKDFFIEDSELPLDPLQWPLQRGITQERVQRNLAEAAYELLSPEFPGPVSMDSSQWGSLGIRARKRFWVQTPTDAHMDWDRWYLLLSEWGLKPEIHEPHWIPERFPGYASPNAPAWKAISVGKFADLPVDLFRSALLEFVRERAGPDRVICDVSQMQLMPYGIRFMSDGVQNTALISKGALVFWTPRLGHWVRSLMNEKRLPEADFPPFITIEEWSLLSRKHVVEDVIGHFEDSVIWSSGPQMLKILRSATESSAGNSYQAIHRLTHEFLGWDRATVRNITVRYMYDWDHYRRREISTQRASQEISHGDLKSYLVSEVEGPLLEVVHRVKRFVEGLL